MRFIIISFLFLFSKQTQAQVSGNVFRDFNANGIKTTAAPDPIEIGLKDVTVNAYPTTGSLITTKTDASGNYSISGGTGPYRVEFILPSYYYASKGSVSNTTVQFVAAGGTANLGVNSPEDYWNNTTQADPFILVPAYVHGDVNNTLATASYSGIIQMNNSASGFTPTKTNVATQQQVGTVWGNAFQRKQNRYFFSAFLKRHAGVGPKGLGGIYISELVGANYGLVGSFSLQGVAPNNGGTTLDFGSITRVSTPSSNDNYLATGSVNQCRDLDAFAKIGKIGMGDIDYDEINKLLITVNLNQQKIVTINAEGLSTTLNNATTATLNPLVNAYDIGSLPGIPTCTSGSLRPWALKMYKGRGYLGVVCDAATSQSVSNLTGYVLSFDPTNIAAGFSTEFSFGFNYRTSVNRGSSAGWHAWVNTWAQTDQTEYYPQPILSDIEFDENGSMNLSIMDRWGHQIGVGQYNAVAGSTATTSGRIMGDMLHVCKVGNSWVMEGSAASCTPNATNSKLDGVGDGTALLASEYFNDSTGDALTEGTVGAMAKLMGTNKIVETMEDPVPVPGDNYLSYFSNGLYWFNTSDGSWSQAATVVRSNDNTAGFPGTDYGTFQKANGLGDIEFALTHQPIEIGNRVFMDTDRDGIQDPNETGIGSVRVELWKAGIFNSFVNTDGNGQFIFTNLLPNTAYEIKILAANIPSGKELTIKDVTSNGAIDVADNDASLVGSDAVITYTTGNAGENNHTLDFGFRLPCNVAFTLTQTNVTCNGNANGAITITTTSGTSPYEYSIDDGATYSTPTSSTTKLYNNLVPNTYKPAVRDTYGCEKKCN